MSRLLSIALVVAGVWVGVEVYSQGLDRAFGGALAFLERGEGARDPGREPLMERVGSTTRDAHRRAEERRERMMGDRQPPP